MDALGELKGSAWAGRSELWLDPLGDAVTAGSCTIEVVATGITYTWTYEGETKTGSITLSEKGGSFTDTFHSPTPMECHKVEDQRGLFHLKGAYGDDNEWGWRIGLCHRTPTDELILQMTNMAPWGEEARAVRFSCQRK